jgi:hypothetical protein
VSCQAIFRAEQEHAPATLPSSQGMDGHQGSGSKGCPKRNKLFGDYAILALSFGLAPSGRIYMHMHSERGKPPVTPSAPYQAARIKDKRRRSAGPGFEPGRASPWLSLTSSQDDIAPAAAARLSFLHAREGLFVGGTSIDRDQHIHNVSRL